MEIAYKTFVGKPEKNRSHGKPRRIWDDNTWILGKYN
jgi:hypothetical protein